MRVDAAVLDEIQVARLSATRLGPVVQLIDTTSTNSVVMSEARRGAPEGLLVVADHQSAGRGRFDRRWEAPAGAALLFSVLLRPPATELPFSQRHLVVAAVSVAMAEAVGTVTKVDLQLKWPNDLIAVDAEHGDRKVAGVLAETSADGAIVVGLGLNVNWSPGGGAATDLVALAGHAVERGEVLVEALLALDRLYGRWELVSRRYRELCATLGRQVTVTLAAGGRPSPGGPRAAGEWPNPGGPGAAGEWPNPGGTGTAGELHGSAVDLDDDGALIVRTARDGLVRVVAGDVFHVSPAPAAPESALGHFAQPQVANESTNITVEG